MLRIGSTQARIERMSYQLKKLQPRHWRVLNLYFEGKSGKETAEMVGLTPRAISYIVNSDVFQEAVAYRRAGMEAAANQAHARAIHESWRPRSRP